ncbi:MAG: hypothetical protein ABIH99_05620, partial [Candidatus Micrarchaeota archaeon]
MTEKVLKEKSSLERLGEREKPPQLALNLNILGNREAAIEVGAAREKWIKLGFLVYEAKKLGVPISAELAKEYEEATREYEELKEKYGVKKIPQDSERNLHERFEFMLKEKNKALEKEQTIRSRITDRIEQVREEGVFEQKLNEMVV